MDKTLSFSAAFIAYNRFGLGIHLKDQKQPYNPKQWLFNQLTQYTITPEEWKHQPKSSSIIAQSMNPKMSAMRKSDKQATRKMMKQKVRRLYQEAVQARTLSALNTQTPFIERLVHFWANHFAISVQKPNVRALAGSYELEAIRPYVLGNFKDMLFAVEKHPAMLLFLDQAKSMGPDSLAATKRNQRKPNKKSGLNENLAREILELHTLGVRSGYSQQDVTELAKALTGWSISNQKKKQAAIDGKHGFAYRPNIHEPGTRSILGKSYPQSNQMQAEAILDDLANHPATAKHIAEKLATHFVSDHPPQSLVDKLANTFLKNKGDLKAVYITLINAPEVWATTSSKFKTPWEWVISSLRGLGQTELHKIKMAQLMNQLNQPVWAPGSPAGYDDIAATWASPNALMQRVELAQVYSKRMGRHFDARQLIDQLLPDAVSNSTRTQIQRAESPSTALALLLVCPEFLRR
jgi:uncharacterized protein (DUF1800 family)